MAKKPANATNKNTATTAAAPQAAEPAPTDTRDQAAPAPAVAEDAPAAPAEPATPAVAADQAATPAEPQEGDDRQAAQPISFIVRGPTKGFRRGGMAFGREPVELRPDDFVSGHVGDFDPAAAERLLAILSEPKLTCSVRLEDGSEEPVHPELIEQLREALARATADA